MDWDFLNIVGIKKLTCISFYDVESQICTMDSSNKNVRKKGGKGVGRGGVKRCRHKGFETPLSKPKIRRLARKGGTERIKGMVYPEASHSFLKKVIRDAIQITHVEKRTTVTKNDVQDALNGVKY